MNVRESIEERIRGHLDAIEAHEGVRIVYACESGSRAWGFPSADSDYDVRFLYLRPAAWYLSIDFEERRDVIERPIEDRFDLSGWDLRKALRLFRKSNPPLMEWLGSPIVYREQSAVASNMRQLVPVYYSPTASVYHYLHMARGNFRDYLKGAEVLVKKYLYVLRPLLAIKWLESGRGVVPTEFRVLVETLIESSGLRREILRLLAAKRSGAELDRGPRMPLLSEFIERELGRLEATVFKFDVPSSSVAPLNDLFRTALCENWS